jgi:hypothetical protein
MTLASDDPAVAKLGTIDTDTGAIATSAASIDGKVTACNTGAVVLAAGAANIGDVDVLSLPSTWSVDLSGATFPTLTVAAHHVTNAGTFAVQATQSGTWIVDLGATDNAVLDDIAESLNGTLAVSAASLPLPSGAATESQQSTQSVLLNAIEISTSGLASTVSGTEVQVDIVAPLPAGTNAIGKLEANSGVDIGDVDVTSCALPTGAATAAKQPAIGTAGTPSADVITVQGITSMTALKVDGSAVTQPVSLTSTTITGTVAATQSGTWTLGANSGVDIGDVDVLTVTPGTGAAHLGKAEDAAHTTGDVGVMALGVRRDTQSTLAATDGDYVPPQMTAFGAMRVCLAANDDYRYAAVSAASSGDNTIVAAAGSGVKIRVLSAKLIAAGAVNVRWESGAGGTALTGVETIAEAGFGYVLPYSPAGHFETAANTLLNLELSAAVQVSGHITYILVS